MKKTRIKIITIMGPTASGKSGIAIELAKKFRGEIISADSRQIYKGMDVGTGKVKKDIVKSLRSKVSSQTEEVFKSEGIPHHLIDVAEPEEDFNVSHFKELAEKKISEISSRKNIPIICGGTAFWIDTLTKNSSLPEVAPDEKLRLELSKKTVSELFRQLQKLDPVRAKNIDAKNKVRLIRAIEICKAIGKVPSHEAFSNDTEKSKYELLQIGIKIERAELNKKIKIRLDERFKEGMIEEVQKLYDKGISWEKLESFGLEYRNIAQYLQGKIDLEAMKERLYFDIIHYAKRQMTWLKRNKEIIWLKDFSEIEKVAKQFLENKC